VATHGLRVLLDVSTQGFTRGLNNAGGSLKKFGGAAALAGAAVGGALVVQLKASVEAAVEAQKSQARFESQMRASGKSLKAHGDRIEEVIQKHSRLAGIDDEDLSDAFTNILRVTGNVDKSMKLLNLTMDFARAKNMDVAKAGELVGKVAGGNVGILSRYGIQVEKGATATQALGLLQEKFAGQAKAYGETAAGAQERFAVAVENLQEKVGEKLLPVLTEVTNKVATFVGEMESGEGAGGRFADKVSEGFAKVKAVAETVWPVLRDAGGFSLGLLRTGFDRLKLMIETVTPTFLKVKDAAIVAFGAVSGWIQQNRPQIDAFASTVRNVLGSAFTVAQTVIGTVIGWLRANLPPAFDAVRGAAVTAFDAIKGAVGTAVQFMTGWISKHRDDIAAFGQAWKNIATGVAVAVGAIVVAVKWAFEHVIAPVMKRTMQIALDAVQRVWPTIKTIIEGALGFIGGVINLFSGIFTGDFKRMWQGIKEMFGGGVTAIKGILKGLLSDLPAIAIAIGRAVIDGIIAGLKGLAGLMKTAIVEAVKWVGSKAVGVAGAAVDIGKKVVSGAINGLGSLGHALLGKVKDALVWAYERIKDLPVVKQILDVLSFGGGDTDRADAKTRARFGDGLGKRVFENVKGRLPSAGGLGGSLPGGSFGGGLMGARPIMAPIAGAASRFGLRVSSGRRPGSITSSGNVSYHSTGEALDVAGAPAGMLAFFRYMKATAGSRLAELIYTPGGVGVRNGAPHRFSGQVAADHFDHVHVAVDSGVPGVGDGIGQIKALWTSAGGSPSKQNLAAAVAMAESGGNPGASNRNSDGSIDRGLWQINSVHGALSTFDRAGNARAAVSISSNGRNWNPWVAFKNGAYRKFLSAAGSTPASGSPAKGKGKKAGPGSVTVKPSGTGFDILPSYTQASAADPGVAAAQAFADRRGGASSPNRPLKGGGPTKGITQEEADARANAPAPDPGPTAEDWLTAGIARAGLTEGLGDDIAAWTALRDHRKGVLDAALADADPRNDAAAINAWKEAVDAIKQLTGEIEQANRLAQLQQQIADNQLKILALASHGPQIVAAVVAAVSGGIGGQVGLGMSTPGYAGGVANYAGGGAGRL
jgi:phage-related protein